VGLPQRCRGPPSRPGPGLRLGAGMTPFAVGHLIFLASIELGFGISVAQKSSTKCFAAFKNLQSRFEEANPPKERETPLSIAPPFEKASPGPAGRGGAGPRHPHPGPTAVDPRRAGTFRFGLRGSEGQLPSNGLHYRIVSLYLILFGSRDFFFSSGSVMRFFAQRKISEIPKKLW